MLTVDDAAHYAVQVQDVAEDTISILHDVVYAVCQLNSPTTVIPTTNHETTSMDRSSKQDASIEVNYDGVVDTVLTGADDGVIIESVVVIRQQRQQQQQQQQKQQRVIPAERPKTIIRVSRRIHKDRGD